MGVARPLSLLFSESDRYLTARYTGHSKDHSLGTLLGIGIELQFNFFTIYSSLAFPDPGYLAAQHLQLTAGSTSD
jgi:hypothetical protein